MLEDQRSRVVLGLLAILNAVWILFMAIVFDTVRDLGDWRRRHDRWYAQRDTMLCEQHNEQRGLMDLPVTLQCFDHPGK